MLSRSWLIALVITLGAAAVASAAEPATGDPVIETPSVKTVDFERHITSLLRRHGCNAGACHGSFQGQGGFRLSLFGQHPAKDFVAIASDLQSRRIVLDAVDDSLILAKPSLRVEHAGGRRLSADSWEYALLRRWIVDGAGYTPNSGRVRRLAIEPGVTITLPCGASSPLKVVAEFFDQTLETITAFSEFRSSDEAVAMVSPQGQVTAVGSGDANIVASYNGTFAHVTVIVPFATEKESFPRPAAANVIDVEIDQRLDALGVASSPAATDLEFLRRATLDVLGTLPTVTEAREFTASGDADQRMRLIDRLLAHPRRSAVWASKMCDITACNVNMMESPESLRPKRAQMWYDWFRQRFISNMPYDQIARGVLCATSRDGEPIERWIEAEQQREAAAATTFQSNYAQRPNLDLFWRRVGVDGAPPVEDDVELVAAAFLGLRLHCARCHHHPYDRWSQRDFAGMAGILSRVQFGISTELRVETNRQLDLRRQQRAAGITLPPIARLQEVYLSVAGRPLVDAADESMTPPTAPDGPVFDDSIDPRREFTDWLVRPDNPYFARSFVNRIWAKYFGAGLVEPVDDLSASNPARNPQLLERLAAEFVRSGYDIAQIERLILSSNAYQRSIRVAGNNAGDSQHFARARIRPLPAETLIDALNAALETQDDFGPDVPSGVTAHEIAPNRLSGGDFNTVFELLGRGDRRSLCDCDRATGPSIRQPIYLMSDPRVLAKITNGRLARLLDEGADDTSILTELYLATLSRNPNEGELKDLQQQIADSADRRGCLIDIVWGLVNTREFSTNH